MLTYPLGFVVRCADQRYVLHVPCGNWKTNIEADAVTPY